MITSFGEMISLISANIQSFICQTEVLLSNHGLDLSLRVAFAGTGLKHHNPYSFSKTCFSLLFNHGLAGA